MVSAVRVTLLIAAKLWVLVSELLLRDRGVIGFILDNGLPLFLLSCVAVMFLLLTAQQYETDRLRSELILFNETAQSCDVPEPQYIEVYRNCPPNAPTVPTRPQTPLVEKAPVTDRRELEIRELIKQRLKP